MCDTFISKFAKDVESINKTLTKPRRMFGFEAKISLTCKLPPFRPPRKKVVNKMFLKINANSQKTCTSNPLALKTNLVQKEGLIFEFINAFEKERSCKHKTIKVSFINVFIKQKCGTQCYVNSNPLTTAPSNILADTFLAINRQPLELESCTKPSGHLWPALGPNPLTHSFDSKLC